MLPHRYWVVFLAVGAPFLARGEERPLEKEGLAPIQEAVRELAREVGYLQEDIVSELTAQKERTLYRHADIVLGEIDQFQRVLKPGIFREELYKQFDGLEQKLHELIKMVDALGMEQRLLQRSAARVAAADEQLHEALAAPEGTDIQMRRELEWQSLTLARTAKQLDRAAQYALGTAQDRAVLVGDLHKLAEATERFQKSLAGGSDRAQLQQDFTAVNQAWERVTRGLQDLAPRENVYLLRTADQVERLHERLFRLLGLKGERPRLTIKT